MQINMLQALHITACVTVNCSVVPHRWPAPSHASTAFAVARAQDRPRHTRPPPTPSHVSTDCSVTWVHELPERIRTITVVPVYAYTLWIHQTWVCQLSLPINSHDWPAQMCANRTSSCAHWLRLNLNIRVSLGDVRHTVFYLWPFLKYELRYFVHTLLTWKRCVARPQDWKNQLMSELCLLHRWGFRSVLCTLRFLSYGHFIEQFKIALWPTTS
jgi:hypothetical protein